MRPGLESHRPRHIWVELLLVLSFAPFTRGWGRGGSQGVSVFPLLKNFV